MAELVVRPEWVEGDGPRVLVEAVDWSRRNHVADVLRRHGYSVVSCAGPEGTDCRCSLAADGCDAADQADVVVHTLRPQDLRNREALLALRSTYPGTPIVVEVPERWADAHEEDYGGCIVVPMPMTDQSMLAVLDLAVRGA